MHIVHTMYEHIMHNIKYIILLCNFVSQHTLYKLLELHYISKNSPP